MSWRILNGAKQFKPGFLARLGVLLISQVVFLFLAVGLVLFVPDEHTDPGAQARLMDRSFTEIAGAVGNNPDAGVSEWKELAIDGRLDAILSGNPQLASLAVFLVVPEYRRVYSWKVAQSSTELIPTVIEADSIQVSDLTGLLANMPHGYKLYLNQQTVTPLYFVRLDFGKLGKFVVVATGVSDKVASSKAGLTQAVPLLFLASTLISLLIVYLLWKRYQKPLEELARVVETTAKAVPSTDQSPRIVAESEEIARLAEGLERLADSRQRDRQAIHEADKKVVQANDELQKSRLFLETIIDRSPSGMIVADSEDRVVIFNRAAAELFGYSEAEILGKPVSTLFGLPNRTGDAINSAAGSEVVCWRKDRESFPAFVASAEISTNGSGKGCVFILRDIAESRSYQDMMVRLDRNVTRGAMAADIGHEINNFLAVLLGNLELLPRSIAKGDEPGIRKKLDTMKANVEKIARFADGLMVESSNEHLQCSSMSANQIVENVIAFLRLQNRFDGVDWVVQLRPDLPMAMIDDARVQQVMVNLLYNAAEAVAEVEGNHVITVTTRPSSHDGVPVVHVDVIDNGPGVQKDKEHLLFRSRFTTKKKGHGFGLMTCGRIVAQHGGWIGYSYENGAHFWFELPLEQVAANASPETCGVTASV
jgi:PAS domain S-box-containing protein